MRKGDAPTGIIFLGFLILMALVLIMLALWFSGFLGPQADNLVKMISDGLENLWRGIPVLGSI